MGSPVVTTQQTRPQDEVQHWRRMRKGLASLLGDWERGQLSAADFRSRITELSAVAQEREKAWIGVVLDANSQQQGERR